VDLVPAAGGDRRHRLIAVLHRARCLRIGHGGGDDRPVRVAVDKREKHLRTFVQGEVHPVVAPRIGLGHPHPRRGLSVLPSRKVKGQNHLVTTVLVQLRILPASGGIDAGSDRPGNPRPLRLPLRTKLHRRRNDRKVVPVINTTLRFRKLRLQSRGQIARLTPFMANLRRQIPTVEPLR